MPCPVGVDIPGNFSLLNYVAMETGMLMRFMTRRRYNSFERNSEKVNLEKPNGNASLCVKCEQCVKKCPQHINIPEELEKTHAILGKRGRISDHYTHTKLMENIIT
jgi:predicted aldo/keto reductase-like oxidoreductase